MGHAEVAGACPVSPCFLMGSAGHCVRGTHRRPEESGTPFCRPSCPGLTAVVSLTPGQAVEPGVQAGDGQGGRGLCRTGGGDPIPSPVQCAHTVCMFTHGLDTARGTGQAGGGVSPCSAFFQREGPQHLSPSPSPPPSLLHMTQTEAGAVVRGHRRVPAWGCADLRLPPAQRGASPSACGRHSCPPGPGTWPCLCIHLSPP